MKVIEFTKHGLPKQVESDLRKHRVLTRFLANAKNYGYQFRGRYTSYVPTTSAVLSHAFMWGLTPEKDGFWKNIHKKLVENAR